MAGPAKAVVTAISMPAAAAYTCHGVTMLIGDHINASTVTVMLQASYNLVTTTEQHVAIA